MGQSFLVMRVASVNMVSGHEKSGSSAHREMRGAEKSRAGISVGAANRYGITQYPREEMQCQYAEAILRAKRLLAWTGKTMRLPDVER